MDQQFTTDDSKFAPPVIILRLASAWQTVGKVNQAVDAYTRLIARYPDSAEALEATEKLLALALAYERQGHYHTALGLYEKLERLR